MSVRFERLFLSRLSNLLRWRRRIRGAVFQRRRSASHLDAVVDDHFGGGGLCSGGGGGDFDLGSGGDFDFGAACGSFLIGVWNFFPEDIFE